MRVEIINMTSCNTRTALPVSSDPFRTLFQDWFPTTYRASSVTFVPTMNVAESTEGYKITLDLPGLTKEEVNVQFSDGLLTVSGERKNENVGDQGRWHVVERTHGTFARSLRFPAGVDGGAVSAEMKDGVLAITVPKAAASKARKISVN